jgi:predicted dehydrogenase
MSDRVRVGVVGTSWWADAMYLPALAKHPLADVRAVTGGRRRDHTRAFAAQWSIPNAYDALEQMLDREHLDAILVLTPNRHHRAAVMASLERGLHVLCEKPLGISAREAREMTEAAERAGVTTMTCFTYRFMPANRYLKALVDQGYVGRPYHLNLRYYAGFGRSGAYAWRFDVGESGGGVSGDLASHWGDHARWLFGDIEAVTAVFSRIVPRGPRPDGATFEVGEDAAMLLLEFTSGARGAIHVSSLAYEPGPFGHRHEMDVHGSAGTLRLLNDWLTVQRIDGSQEGEPATHELPIPDEHWAGARRGTVHETYKDIFREQDAMTRGFISAVARGEKASPDFADGLAVQRLLEAAARSAREGRRVTLAEIEASGG